MTLRRILLLVGCALALLPICGGLLTVWLVRDLGDLARSLYDNEIIGITYINKAQEHFEHYVLTETRDRPSVQQMIMCAGIAAERAVGSESRAQSKIIEAMANRLLDAEPPEAARLIEPIRETFETALRNFYADGLAARDRAEAAEDRSLWRIGLITAVITVIAILFSIVIWRTVIPPLRRAVAVADAIAAGRLDNQIEAAGASEPIQLLRALGVMQTAIMDNINALERAADETTRANQAKSSFLAMMSHEIRTPMNGVLGLAESLLEEAMPPEQRRIVKTILGAGSTLMQLLNDILDFSKLEAGRLEFETEAFSPAEVVADVVSLLGSRASAKGLALTSSVPPDPHLIVAGDVGRVRQVLVNLTSNAIKFTADGSVGITLDAAMAGGDRDLVWTVSDTGIGIPADRIVTLFADFVQADRSIARRFGGTGLGLAISKRLIDQMGGSLTVSSVSGLGSTFRVRLRLPVARMPADAETGSEDNVAGLTSWLRGRAAPFRILIAEDNATNQLVLSRYLAIDGLELEIVSNGREAVRAATRAIPDLILMDIQMPVMDGLPATRELRALGGAFTRLPIIAVTANAYAEDIAACREAGMNCFVSKPINRGQLFAAIQQEAGRGPVAARPLPGRPRKLSDAGLIIPHTEGTATNQS